jgi:uridine phosphorylase
MSVPNIENKHKSEAVFNARDFLDFKRKIGRGPRFKPPKGVVLCYQKELLDYIERRHEVFIPKGTISGMRLLKDTDDAVGVVVDFGIGAPAVVTVLEELIAFGVREFVSIGYAGSLQKHIRIGETVVCERAIRDEGTSYHYSKNTRYAFATETLTDRIKKALMKNRKKFTGGTSWTTDAPYRETRLEVMSYQEEGVATVDMEASALFSLAEYRNVSIGVIFTISDSVADLRWKPHFHFIRIKRGLRNLFPVAVDALLME